MYNIMDQMYDDVDDVDDDDDDINELDHSKCAAYYNRLVIQSKCDIPDEDCAICLTAVLHKKVAYLPCKHYFHLDCLKLSVDAKNYTCPLCRYNLISPLQQSGYFVMPIINIWDQLFQTILIDNSYAVIPAAILIEQEQEQVQVEQEQELEQGQAQGQVEQQQQGQVEQQQQQMMDDDFFYMGEPFDANGDPLYMNDPLYMSDPLVDSDPLLDEDNLSYIRRYIRRYIRSYIL